MNTMEMKGNWNDLKGQIKEKWGELTDDDLTRIDGKRDQLVGAVQKRYGVAQSAAEREIDSWLSSR